MQELSTLAPQTMVAASTQCMIFFIVLCFCYLYIPEIGRNFLTLRNLFEVGLTLFLRNGLAIEGTFINLALNLEHIQFP